MTMSSVIRSLSGVRRVGWLVVSSPGQGPGHCSVWRALSPVLSLGDGEKLSLEQ